MAREAEALVVSNRDGTVAREEERALVEAACRGDAGAFAQLVARHRLAVFGYFRPRLIEPTDADDLCQELFLRMYQNLGKYNHSVPLRAWLMGIARNVLREYARAARRNREVAWTELCLKLDHAVADDTGPFDEVLPLLPGCLESLGTNARSSLQMHYGERCKVAQIAEKMCRSSDAVRLLLYRARKALKRCLDGKMSHGVD